MNNFAIHIKFHLKNPGLNFQKSIQMFQTIPSNPKSLITPFLLQHGKLVSYTIKYSTTLIHGHLILLTLSFNFIIPAFYYRFEIYFFTMSKYTGCNI